MYKILAIQISMVLQILCDDQNPVPHYRTSGTKDLEEIQEQFLSIMKQATDAAIEHQQKNNATEPLDVHQLKEFKEMLRTVNGTDLEEMQVQNMDALRHGRLDVTLSDLAKIFLKRKQKLLQMEQASLKNREKMRKRIDKWARKEEMKAKKKV